VIDDDLFTLAEFAAYIQDESPADATVELLRTLVRGLIDEIGTFTDAYPASVKIVGLTATARAYNNPQGVVSESMGSYSYTRNQGERRTGVYLTDEEKTKVFTASGADGGVFDIDTVSTTITHADICAINFGATYCSCGASLTLGWPLYEIC
jgi:hypothetical protein